MSSIVVTAGVVLTDEEIIQIVAKKSRRIKKLIESGIDFEAHNIKLVNDGWYIELFWNHDEDGS